METVESVVVGAGVIGLAIARSLSAAGQEVVVLEAEADIGTGTSSRNSEVIHAGIYYPTGSLKARLCVSGRDMLYRYCAEHGVEHRRLGKLIVAGNRGDLETLQKLQDKASANSVDDLRFVSKEELSQLEPEVDGAGALISPSTGIVDSHGLMLAYQGEAEDNGMAIAVNSPLLAAKVTGSGFELQAGGASSMTLGCRKLINSAGLGAQEVANAISGLDARHIPQRYLNKGSYFTMRGRAPFRHLIYPVPPSASLGIHLTLDLAGQARFGPDQEWIDEINYAVDPTRAKAFYDSVRRYYPGLADDALDPAYSGIRPKIQAPGDPMADFAISGPRDHGVPGLVNLFGMESPGLTSSLAIGEYVRALLAA